MVLAVEDLPHKQDFDAPEQTTTSVAASDDPQSSNAGREGKSKDDSDFDAELEYMIECYIEEPLVDVISSSLSDNLDEMYQMTHRVRHFPAFLTEMLLALV